VNVARTGRDLCACEDTFNFYMVDIDVPGVGPWVECRPCAVEECPPGYYNFGCGDVNTLSSRPNGDCFPCPDQTYAKPDENCIIPYRCSGRGRKENECDDCRLEQCNDGTFLVGCGLNSSGTCAICPPRTYSVGREYREECTPCGCGPDGVCWDVCSTGTFLKGCSFRNEGKCIKCTEDEFSSSDGTLAVLQLDACSKCPAGEYTPPGTPNHKCQQCPVQQCEGDAGKVYLQGCRGMDTGVCKNVTCTRVDVNTLCSVSVYPTLGSAIKIAGKQAISDLVLSNYDSLGSAIAWIREPTSSYSILAVSAPRDATAVDGNGEEWWRIGSVYVFRIAAEIKMPDLPPARPLHLAGSGDVEVLLKLQSTSCKLPLANGDEFGYAMTSVGDLDNDGVHELVVSAPYRESPIYSYTDAGAVCILFVGIKRIDGQDRLQVKSSVTITLETMGAAVEKDSPGILALQQQYSLFGCALAAVGDVDGDGVPDMAVSACGVDDGAGAVLLLLLSPAGLVKSIKTMSKSTQGVGALRSVALAFRSNGDTVQLKFGRALAAIGDVNGDGYMDLAVSVGAHNAVVLVYLKPHGDLLKIQPVTDSKGTLFEMTVRAISAAADLNGDSVPDLLLGSNGAVVILTLNRDGSSIDSQKLNTTDEDVFAGTYTKCTVSSYALRRMSLHIVGLSVRENTIPQELAVILATLLPSHHVISTETLQLMWL